MFVLNLFVCGLVLFAAGCGGAGSVAETSPAPERITIAGNGTQGAHGIFDPSIALDPATGRLWMSYSSVDPSVSWPTQNHDVVSTRLAYSDDNGKIWTGSSSGGLINSFADVNIALAPPNDAGTWINEVSQLIYDPGADATQKWKLLWHHYLVINNDRRFEHGWIAMKTAATPEGLATATEVKLFAGATYDAGNDTAGGGSQSPLGGAPKIQLDTAVNAALNACLFTEPGMYATSGALYVTLHCVKSSLPIEHLTVLLKCTSPCNAESAASWSYLGTVLNDSNAAALGFDTGFSAPGIFESGGSVYLISTPVQTSGALWHDYYSGCRLYRFTNIDAAQLQLSGTQPALIASVDGTSGSFNGACAYQASSNQSGVLYSELLLTASDKFRMYMSHKNY